MKLLHDPANGELPHVLVFAYQEVIERTNFHNEPADVPCPRCGRDVRCHVWQLVDDTEPEQDGVIGCGGDRW